MRVQVQKVTNWHHFGGKINWFGPPKKKKKAKKESSCFEESRCKLGSKAGFNLRLQCVGLAYHGNEIVLRFIIEYSSLRDFGP